MADEEASDLLDDDLEKTPLAPVKRKKGAKQRAVNISRGIVHIHATFNNTRISISDMSGNVLAWSTAGKVGFKGSRKSTAYAAQVAAAEASRRVKSMGMVEVTIQIKGPGAGREAAVRGVVAAGLEVAMLRDVTPIPHNGCRPRKRRRV